MNILSNNHITLTSQLLKNTCLEKWDGYQKNQIKTSSKLVKALKEFNQDLPINTPLIKTVLKYDYIMLVEKLKSGLRFEYQDYTYLLIKVKQYIRVTAIYTKSLEGNKPLLIRLENVVLSQALIDNMKSENYCNDVKDILGELLKRGL